MAAPGVNFQTIDLNRPALTRLRTDICGFLGYTERGPVDRAVKLQSWRQFLDTFGPPLPFAYTGHCVRLFFENGGDACYMLRLTNASPETGGAQVASTVLDTQGPVIKLSTAFSTISRTASKGTGPAVSPTFVSGQAASSMDGPASNPGAWGNRLAVRVIDGGLGSTMSKANQPNDGASIRVEQIAGFNVGSWVRLSRGATRLREPAIEQREVLAQVAGIDPALREITWTTPVANLGLDFNEPVRLETIEFSLALTLDGEEIERIRNVSLDSLHPRYLDRILTQESLWIRAETTIDSTQLPFALNWPQPGYQRQFSGGTNGLDTVTSTDAIAALTRFEHIDEISVLAAPDVVLRAEVEANEPETPPGAGKCDVPAPLPSGVVNGEVTLAGDGGPVAGVRVTSRDIATRAALTGPDGRFTLTGLPPGQIGLRLTKTGFIPLDVTTQAYSHPLPSPQQFELSLRSLPTAFTDDEIMAIQETMIRQGERGLYRVTLLDPPQDMLSVEGIQGWRARFDSSYAALYWPWIVDTGSAGTTARELPPSGAVAGLIARMDRAEGPQRAPANRPFRDIAGLSLAIDDATHELLNDIGVNVIRAYPGRGIAPQGARTLSSNPEWRYLGVRRLMLMLAEAIEEGHQWAVFEPNSAILRNAIAHSLRAFLTTLWTRGAFTGRSPEEAFEVKCDADNNPPEVIDAGQLVAEVAVAPTHPYEFIKLRLGRTDRLQVQIQE